MEYGASQRQNLDLVAQRQGVHVAGEKSRVPSGPVLLTHLAADVRRMQRLTNLFLGLLASLWARPRTKHFIYVMSFHSGTDPGCETLLLYPWGRGAHTGMAGQKSRGQLGGVPSDTGGRTAVPLCVSVYQV